MKVMIKSGRIKQQQISNNSTSSINQKEISQKRKPFTRKPAIINNNNINQFQRKIKQQNLNLSATCISQQGFSQKDDNSSIAQLGRNVKLKRKTDIFRRKEIMDTSIAEGEEMFFTPKVKQIQREQNQKTLFNDFNLKKSSTELKQFKRILSRINSKADINIFNDSTIDQTKNVTIYSNKGKNNQENSKDKIVSKVQQDSRRKSARSRSIISIKTESKIQICEYCSNSKKIVQMINLKCSKIEQQLQNKRNNVMYLQKQVNKYKQQVTKLLTEKQKIQKIKNIQLLTIFQENQKLKRQIYSLKDYIKYTQIQNAILYRQKNQNLTLNRLNDNLKKQNYKLKTQIFSIQKHEFKKKKNNVVNQPYQISFKKIQKYDAQMSSRSKQQFNINEIPDKKDDDVISLSFSDMSLQQFQQF